MLRTIGLALFVTAVACGDGLASEAPAANEPAAAPAAAAQPAAPAASAKTPASAPAHAAGAVTGTIKFEGDVPELTTIDITSDPVCEGLHPDGMRRTNVRVGKEGGLKDVFVQLTGVPDERYETPDEPVELDQEGCTYHPHVFGVMKKQDIKIVNSDDTLHNIHAVPKTNKEFNVGMPIKGMSIKKDFRKPEDAIHIKCDVHAWMSCYVFSMEHPYWCVTDENGRFSIDTTDLPDGEYGVRAWHEELGTKEGKVTVKDGAATFDLSFKK
jgi:hypothetical protein